MWPFTVYFISTPEVNGYNKFLVNHLYVVKFSSNLSVYMILMRDMALLSLCINEFIPNPNYKQKDNDG